MVYLSSWGGRAENEIIHLPQPRTEFVRALPGDILRGIDSGGDTITDGDSAPVVAGEVESGETRFEAVDFSQDFAVPDFKLGDRLLPGMVFFDDRLSSDSENLAQIADHRASEFSSWQFD